MTTAVIQLNGVTGSNTDLPINTLVQLTNANNTGAATWSWAILDQPAGTADALSATTIVNPTFTPKKEGSYFLRLVVNATLADERTAYAVAAVRQVRTRARIPAAGETIQASSSRGWALDVNAMLQLVDAARADPDVLVAQAGAGGLVTNTVVRVSTTVTILSGLPGEAKLPAVVAADSATPADLSAPLYVVVAGVDGSSSPANGTLVQVRRSGVAYGATVAGSPSVGDAVYLAASGAMAATGTRRIGTVLVDNGPSFDVQVDGTGFGAEASGPGALRVTAVAGAGPHTFDGGTTDLLFVNPSAGDVTVNVGALATFAEGRPIWIVSEPADHDVVINLAGIGAYTLPHLSGGQTVAALVASPAVGQWLFGTPDPSMLVTTLTDQTVDGAKTYTTTQTFGADIAFTNDAEHLIAVAARASGDVSGRSLSILAGDGHGTGDGGELGFVGGGGADGGAVGIVGGTATTGEGGYALVAGGTGVTEGGDAIVDAGAASGMPDGDVLIGTNAGKLITFGNAVAMGVITARTLASVAVEVYDAATAAVTNVLKLRHRLSTGTAANGLGAAVLFELPHDGGAVVPMAAIEAAVTTAFSSTYTASLYFSTAVSGGAVTRRWRVQGSGNFLPITPNTYNLGGTGAEAASGYFGTSVVIGVTSGQLTVEPTGLTRVDGVRVAASTGTPNANSILDVVSTTKGLLPPRLTTTQRNTLEALLSSGETGMVVWDSTLPRLCRYSGTEFVPGDASQCGPFTISPVVASTGPALVPYGLAAMSFVVARAGNVLGISVQLSAAITGATNVSIQFEVAINGLTIGSDWRVTFTRDLAQTALSAATNGNLHVVPVVPGDKVDIRYTAQAITNVAMTAVGSVFIVS